MSRLGIALKKLRADWIPARFVLRTGRFYRSTMGTIELDGPADQRREMFQQVARCWQHLGEQEPYWSVLTAPQFKMSHIGSTGDEFYRSGQACLSTINAFFARSGQAIADIQSVLEFGCGVGRETTALASRFRRVVGVDISAAHLALARQAVSRHHQSNVGFVQLASIEAVAALPQCDLLYSVIALQHNPPPVMLEVLSQLFDRLRPGGYALFQLPTFWKGYSFSWREQLARTDSLAMEKHVLPQAAVYTAMRRYGLDLLEVHEDRAVGDPDIISNTFFARKSVCGG
ncbi:MAG: class I SAM-dependent methyltransferase [Alphaproteobacteria bacterium]|jgi:SAM-dependent methyltransferase